MRIKTVNAEGCEYCVELQQPAASRFRQIYGSLLPSRIVHETERFVVMPTIGQIVPSSMLLIPRRHIETLAAADEATIVELAALARDLRESLTTSGHVVTFEHGARSGTGGGCGIYHAHLHVAPLPRPVSAPTLLPDGKRVGSIVAALSDLRPASEYLLIHSGNDTRVVDLSGRDRHEYASQHFRRRIVELLNLDYDWNWRACTTPEPRLIESVKAFRARLAA